MRFGSFFCKGVRLRSEVVLTALGYRVTRIKVYLEVCALGKADYLFSFSRGKKSFLKGVLPDNAYVKFCNNGLRKC